MTVLERLDALRSPIYAEEIAWSPLGGRVILGLDYRPSGIGGYKAAALRRIDEAMKGWTIRHLWRFMHTGMRRKVVAALKLQTTEAAWFKMIPLSHHDRAGKENRLTLTSDHADNRTTNGK